MRSTLIYVALCVPNNKLYFGITAGAGGLRRRKNNHCASAAKPKTRFQHALRKHSPGAFVWYELGSVPTWEDACEIERFLISYFGTRDPNKGYNDTDGGEGVPGRTVTLTMKQCQKGRVLSEEHRAKLREAWKNRPPKSAATRQKMREYMLGRSMDLSDESRARISSANKGKKRSAETRAKMSAAQQNKKMKMKEAPRADV